MSNAPNLFIDTLREMRGGVSLEELSAHLQSLIQSVQHTGKKGALVYTLTIKPATAASHQQLIVSDGITTKEPRLERSSDIFFATDAGELTRRNPNQRDLELHEVKAEPKVFKEASNG